MNNFRFEQDLKRSLAQGLKTFFGIFVAGSLITIFSCIFFLNYPINWGDSRAKIALVVIFLVSLVFALRRIRMNRNAFVEMQEEDLYLCAPNGEYYEVGINENDVRRKILVRKGPKGQRYYYYGLNFEDDGKKVDFPLNWLSRENRHHLLNEIEKVQFRYEILPIGSIKSLRLNPKGIVRRITTLYSISLLLMVIFLFPVVILSRGAGNSFLGLLPSTIAILMVLVLALRMLKKLSQCGKLEQKIPKEITILEEGIKLDQQMIRFDDIDYMSMDYLEEPWKERYLRIVTRDREHTYLIAGYGDNFLELKDDNEKEIFMHCLQHSAYEQDIDFYIM